MGDTVSAGAYIIYRYSSSMTLTKYSENWDTPVVAVWWSGSRWVLRCMGECQTRGVEPRVLTLSWGVLWVASGGVGCLTHVNRFRGLWYRTCGALLLSPTLPRPTSWGWGVPSAPLLRHKSYMAARPCAILLRWSETVLFKLPTSLFKSVDGESFYFRLAGLWPLDVVCLVEMTYLICVCLSKLKSGIWFSILEPVPDWGACGCGCGTTMHDDEPWHPE